MMIDRWIAEATECDFKVALEVKKPKSWLKSVSAFANGIGGTLFFGIDDDRNADRLSQMRRPMRRRSAGLIKERITPYPSFVLAPEREKRQGHPCPVRISPDGLLRITIKRTVSWKPISASAMKA